MNKRLKKKYAYKKMIIHVRPAICEEIEDCPEFLYFSWEAMYKGLNLEIPKQYDRETDWIWIERPWKSFGRGLPLTNNQHNI